MTSRRAVLAALAAAALPLPATASLPGRLGLQLYTLAPDASRDLPGTLAQIREIGFTEVELHSLLSRTPAQLGAMLRTAGLACPSIHVPLDGSGLTLAAPARIAEALDALGARHAVVPMPPLRPKLAPSESWQAAMARAGREMTVEAWRDIAARLDAAGAELARHGMTAGYHNHDVELRPLADGAVPLDLLIADTDPRHVVFELDIGWVAAVGADPAALLRRHGDRFRLLHLKDAAAVAPPDRALAMTPAEPGKGLVDWHAVARALRRTPVAHAFVEQEPPFAGPRIDAARRGFAFFRELARHTG